MSETSCSKGLPTSQAIGMGSFRVTKAVKPKATGRKRAKFDPNRLERVNATRKRGACLRCRLLKITCSCDDPCTTCLELARMPVNSKGYEKKMLRFSECIRTSLVDVSIFMHAIPSEELQSILRERQKGVQPSGIELDLNSRVVWNLGSLTETFMDWMKSPEASTTSKIGILSSPKFWDLIDIGIHEDIKKEFQALFHLQSLAYNQYAIPKLKGEPRNLELLRMGAMAGHRCLKALDKLLDPQALASNSKIGGSKIDKLRSLFLILVGTILAVGYTPPIVDFPTLPSQSIADGSEEQAKSNGKTSSSPFSLSHNLYDAMQEHLCRTLAHFAVYIAEKLELSITVSEEKFLLDAAHARWNREGKFTWLSQFRQFEDRLDTIRRLRRVLAEMSNKCDLFNKHFSIQYRNTYDPAQYLMEIFPDASLRQLDPESMLVDEADHFEQFSHIGAKMPDMNTSVDIGELSHTFMGWCYYLPTILNNLIDKSESLYDKLEETYLTIEGYLPMCSDWQAPRPSDLHSDGTGNPLNPIDADSSMATSISSNQQPNRDQWCPESQEEMATHRQNILAVKRCILMHRQAANIFLSYSLFLCRLEKDMEVAFVVHLALRGSIMVNRLNEKSKERLLV